VRRKLDRGRRTIDPAGAVSQLRLKNGIVVTLDLRGFDRAGQRLRRNGRGRDRRNIANHKNALVQMAAARPQIKRDQLAHLGNSKPRNEKSRRGIPLLREKLRAGSWLLTNSRGRYVNQRDQSGRKRQGAKSIISRGILDSRFAGSAGLHRGAPAFVNRIPRLQQRRGRDNRGV
jgi:hypothetical protein